MTDKAKSLALDLAEEIWRHEEYKALYTCDPGCRGWAVLNDNEIQRCDTCRRFEDDEAAVQHVLSRIACLLGRV